MKYKKIIYICVILTSILLITGCGKEEQKVIEEKKPTYASKENLKITYTGKTKSNDLLYFLKNKDDNLARDIKVEVEFWKKTTDEETGEEKDILVGTSKKEYDFINSSTTIVGVASVGKKEYDYYKIFIDIEEKNSTNAKESVRDDVIIEDNTKLTLTDEEIEQGMTPDTALNIVLKNKGKNRINLIEVGVVFYENGEIVGYTSKKKENLDSMTKSSIRVDFPVGRSYSDKVKFDSYRIYINQAYRKIY